MKKLSFLLPMLMFLPMEVLAYGEHSAQSGTGDVVAGHHIGMMGGQAGTHFFWHGFWHFVVVLLLVFLSAYLIRKGWDAAAPKTRRKK